MSEVRIKGWAKFQHFKDRKPPWIKLYRDLLDDLEWHDLDPAAAKILVMLWLIASEDDGRLPESKKLAFRLRISEAECKSLILKLSHWLDHDDIAAISGCHQDDAPETETETETETEENPSGSSSTKVDACPHQEIISAYHDLLPASSRIKVWDGARAANLRARWREDPKRQSLEYWRRLFAYIAKSEFLTGQRYDNDRRPFFADLDWIVMPKNFAKIIEGKYHAR